MPPNGLQLQEVGDFEALNCLPPQNLIRSTKLHLTTESPIFLQVLLAVRCFIFARLIHLLFIAEAEKLKVIVSFENML